MDAKQNRPYHITLQLSGDRELHPEELDDATRQLRSELLDLQVESVDLIGTQAVPEGAKSAEAISLGTMAMTVLPVFVPKVMDFLQSWVTRHDGKTIKVKTQAGDRSIELEFSHKAISQGELRTMMETLTNSLATSDPKE